MKNISKSDYSVSKDLPRLDHFVIEVFEVSPLFIKDYNTIKNFVYIL